MSELKCTCGNGGVCSACRALEISDYWCDTCETGTDEKRCPACGLKTRRTRK